MTDATPTVDDYKNAAALLLAHMRRDTVAFQSLSDCDLVKTANALIVLYLILADATLTDPETYIVDALNRIAAAEADGQEIL